MSDEEKKPEIEQITDEHVKFAHLLESSAFIIQQMGQKIVERMNAISAMVNQLPAPPNFVFNVGTLIGEMDQVAHAARGYLESYQKFREAYVAKIEHKKEEMH